MSSKADSLKAAALAKGDHSKLYTKNVHGQMFLDLAPGVESAKSDDSSTDTEPESDIEIDCEPFDPNENLTLGLLDENGREVKEIFVKGHQPCSKGSFDALWKKRIIKSEVVSGNLGKISSIAVPSMPKPPEGLKWLPVTSYKENPFPSAPRNTYIIRTSLPLSSLNLKSLIHSGSLSGLVSNNPTGKPFNLPGAVTVTPSQTITTVYPPFSSHHTTPVLSLSTPSINLACQKPLTATTNSITSPISCVNKSHNSSLSDRILVQKPSTSLNTNSTVITPSTYLDTKLVQDVAAPSVQSFLPASTNVIKPVLDTGQSIPKVQISNPNLLGPVITSDTSQGLTTNVQSNVLSSGHISQLVNIGLANNSNSPQMAPCVLFSTTETGTSSTTLSTTKVPIIHTGLLPQNPVSGIKKETDQTSLMSNVISSTSALTRPTSTSVFTPSNNTAAVHKIWQPTPTLTSSIDSPLVYIKKTDSNTSGTPFSLTSTSISDSSPSPCTFVSIPDPNMPGSLLVKIIPISTSSATSGNTFTLSAGISSVAGTMNSTVCSSLLAGNSDQHATLSADTAKKLNPNQVYHNIPMNISPSAARVSTNDLQESKTDFSINKSPPVNNIKTIQLMMPSGACSHFSPTVTSSHSITTISSMNSANEAMNANLQKDDPVTKISDNNDTQEDSGIVSSTSDTASPLTTTSAGVDLKSPQKSQEKTNSVKVDDTVQFLKLGSLANNESNSAKMDAANNDSKLVNGLGEGKENDSDTTDNSSLLKLPINLMKDINSDAVKLNLISNVHKVKQEFNDANNTADAAKVNPTSAVLNLNAAIKNTNLIKVPVSLINGRHVITLPSQTPASSSVPGIALSNVASSSNMQLVSPTSKSTTQVPDSQLPTTTKLVTLANKTQNVITLVSQTPAVAPLISAARNTQNVTQLVTVSNQTLTTTQHVTLASKMQSVPQLVSLLSTTSTTTNVVKLTSSPSFDTQLTTLSTQIPKGSQLFKLTTPFPPGTQLSSLAAQIPKGTQFIKLSSGTPLSGTQFITVTSPAQKCSQNLTFTSQALINAKVVTSGSQVSPGTHIVPLPNQATTRPQLVPLTTQNSSPIVSLTNQATETTGIATLVNQGATNSQFVKLSNLPSAQLVKLSNPAISGTHLIKVPNSNNSGTKGEGQNLSGTQFVKLNLVNSSTAPYFKLMPINNSASTQLGQPTKIICKSVPPNSNGQTSTNMSNGKGVLPIIKAELLRKLQSGESRTVVNAKTPLCNSTQTSTTTTTSVSNLPMHSLLLAKQKEQKISSSSALPLQKNEINVDEDLPMTLKIDSIFSLKDDKTQALDYWGSPHKDKSGKDDQAETRGSNIANLTTPKSSCKCEKDVSTPVQHKVVSNKDVAIETETVNTKPVISPQSKPIVYARLNKPKTHMNSSPSQKKSYRIHDLSNHFPTAQRKQIVEICRPFKMGRWVSVIKEAKKPQAYKIKGRVHVSRVKQKKYAFLQPRVMLPQLYIPARMKSVKISRLPAETIKSLACEDDCIHRVRVSYTTPVMIKSSPHSNKKYMIMKVNHNTVLKQYSPNSTPSTPVRKLPMKNSPINVRVSPPAHHSKEDNSINKPSVNNDDALSCLELACGIIQDDTLKKRKSLLRRQDEDNDWVDDLEMQYRSNQKRMHGEKVSPSDFTNLLKFNALM